MSHAIVSRDCGRFVGLELGPASTMLFSMPRPHDPSGGLRNARCRDDLQACALLIIHAEKDTWAAAEAIGELNRLSVIYEEKIVRRARAEGYSWDHLALLMGTSRQALHARWRRRLQGNRYDPKSGLNKRRWEEKYTD